MKQLYKNFNSFIKKTIFKVNNKTNNNFEISKFNKYLITAISLLFFYLFYLSIPVLYDKTWIKSNLEKKLHKEFKISFIISSDISYRILPAPHFLIKDAKMLKNDNKKGIPISEIKNLKVFVNQNNFFNKKKIQLKKITIDNANFSLFTKDLKLIDNSNNNFSNKKIKIKNSNVFFRDKGNQTIAIIKINKAFLFFDNKKLFNLFKLEGEVFKIPFVFNVKKDSFENKEINIKAQELNLNIFNRSSKNDKNFFNGENVITFLSSTIRSKYSFNKNIIIFESSNSRVNNSKINYNGMISTNPFDLNLDINLSDYKIVNIFDMNSILIEFIKTGLLFDENISANNLITLNSNIKEEIFQEARIKIIIKNGKINLNETIFVNKRIGSLEFKNSRLFFENKNLKLNSDIMIKIKDPNKLFAFLLTSKKARKPIKNILVNLDYDFSTNLIKFNNVIIDDKKINDKLLAIIRNFDGYSINNLNKTRLILNDFFSSYEG